MKIAVSLMAGIVLAKYLVVPFPLFPLLVVVVLLAFCLWRYEQLQSAVIGLCMVVLGALLMIGPTVREWGGWQCLCRGGGHVTRG